MGAFAYPAQWSTDDVAVNLLSRLFPVLYRESSRSGKYFDQLVLCQFSYLDACSPADENATFSFFPGRSAERWLASLSSPLSLLQILGFGQTQYASIGLVVV